MAATCQERGITHIKDVFEKKANKPETKENNTGNFFFGFSMGNNNNDNKSKSNNQSNNNNRAGGFLLRSGQNRGVDIMEIPVPISKRRTSDRTSESEDIVKTKDTYLSPRAVQKGRRESSGSPKKSPAPLPPPIATPPPPPPFNNMPPPPPYNNLPPPPPPLLPPPPPPTNFSPPPSPVKLPQPPSPDSLQHVSSPGYTHVITADIHQKDDSNVFEDAYLNSSPISRRLSGDYQTGPLCNGIDDDGDILNNLDTSLFSNDSLPKSPKPHTDSGVTEIHNSKNIGGSTSPLFKKNNERNSRLNSSSNARSSITDTESSLLTGSEHGAASSGYFSGTDSDRPPSPPPAFKSPTTINESSSSFEEDECTLDFDDDGFVENKHKKVYHEYQGEDFAKYLQDDDYSTSTTTLTRRVQKHKQQNPRNAVSPNRRYAAQGQKKQGIKDKITQAFTLTRSEKRNYATAPPPNKTKIHNFSFMNSKMGMYASQDELNEYVAKDLETKSDFGGVKKQAEVPSWYKDTLSASTLRRTKDMLDKRTLSSSVPNLTEAESYQTMPNVSTTKNVKHRGESLSDFGADIKSKKKVNRFKFWKGIGKKKNTKDVNARNENGPQVVDVRL